MLFNSFNFFIFFAVFYSLFLIISQKHKAKLFLIASICFYLAFGPKYIVLLSFLVITDFYCGKIIHYKKTKQEKTLFLAVALIANLGILFVFKYIGFFGDVLSAFSSNNSLGSLSLILPIGLSFYTFQGLSYVIDIYRKQTKPENNFIIFALYVSAFPQLVAGPIERAKHLIPQLKKEFSFSQVPLREASFLILIGLLKKIVIADNLGIVVDKVYAAPESYVGSVLALATLFFGFQIYCDFSGYVDIARGLGKFLGIDFVLNFKKPYFSANITEFWRRWHISLSNWVRDYIYISLGGNKGKRKYINLFLTMIIMGLWHGAGLNFVIWGMYHGVLLIFHKIIRQLKVLSSFPKILKICITFILVNLGWVFFRSGSAEEAFYIFKNIFSSSLLESFQYQEGMLLGVYLILGLIFFELLDLRFHFKKYITKMHFVLLALLYIIIVNVIVFLGVKETVSFIYFQF